MSYNMGTVATTSPFWEMYYECESKHTTQQLQDLQHAELRVGNFQEYPNLFHSAGHLAL